MDFSLFVNIQRFTFEYLQIVIYYTDMENRLCVRSEE